MACYGSAAGTKRSAPAKAADVSWLILMSLSFHFMCATACQHNHNASHVSCLSTMQAVHCSHPLQAVQDLTKDDDEDEPLPVKRSKHFDNKDASAAKTARSSASGSTSKIKSSPKPAAAQKASAEKAAEKRTSAQKAKPGAKKATKGRKAAVIEDDSDHDFEVLPELS